MTKQHFLRAAKEKIPNILAKNGDAATLGRQEILSGSSNFLYEPLTLVSIPDTESGEPPHLVSECMFRDAEKNMVFSTPGFLRPVPSTGDGQINYRIGPSPLGGLGMFATGPLHVGDLIMSERPLLVQPFSAGTLPGDSHLTPGNAYNDLLQAGFDRLSPENQEAFSALANVFGDLYLSKVRGIVETNGYALGELCYHPENPEMHMYTGVFNEISRINHSCSPNIAKKFDIASFSYVLRATTHIDEGEELFVAYCNIYQPAAKRRRELASVYHFQCSCRSCANSTPNSDLLRKTAFSRVSAIQKKIVIWSNSENLDSASGDVLLASASSLLSEMEKEGIQSSGSYFELLRAITNLYTLRKDPTRAVEFAKKAEGVYIASSEKREDIDLWLSVFHLVK